VAMVPRLSTQTSVL